MPLMWIFDTPCPLPCLPLPLTSHPLPQSDWYSTQLIRRVLDIEYGPGLLLPCSMVDQHPVIDSSILALKFQHRFWCLGFQHKVVVAVRAVLVTFFEHCGIFSEGLFALFASKGLGCVRLRVAADWDNGVLPCPSSAVTHDLRSRDGTRRNQTIFGLLNS